MKGITMQGRRPFQHHRKHRELQKPPQRPREQRPPRPQHANNGNVCISRYAGESILIGKNGEIEIFVSVVESCGKVRLSISAPRHIPIHRDEIFDEMQADGGVISLAKPKPKIDRP